MSKREKIIEILKKYDLTSDKFSIAPNIPDARIKKAIESFELNFFDPESVIFFADETLLGSGKNGIILTEEDIYIKEMMRSSKHYELDDIESVDIKGNRLSINGKQVIALTQSTMKKVEHLVLALREIIENLEDMDESDLEDMDESDLDDRDESDGISNECSKGKEKKEKNKDKKTKNIDEERHDVYVNLRSLKIKLLEKYDLKAEYDETIKKIDKKTKERSLSLGTEGGIHAGICTCMFYIINQGMGRTDASWFRETTIDDIETGKKMYEIATTLFENMAEIISLYKTTFNISDGGTEEPEFVI